MRASPIAAGCVGADNRHRVDGKGLPIASKRCCARTSIAAKVMGLLQRVVMVASWRFFTTPASGLRLEPNVGRRLSGVMAVCRGARATSSQSAVPVDAVHTQ
jgi:hypothetical protein